MKKKYLILTTVLLVGLTGCGQKQNNQENNGKTSTNQQSQNTSTSVNNNTTQTVEPEDKIVILENKIIQKNYQIVEKKYPQVIKEYNTYNNEIKKVVSYFKGANKQVIENTLPKLVPYMVKYETMIKTNPEKAEKYKKFIKSNLSKKGIKIDDKKLEELVKTGEYKKVVIQYKKLEKYILPDGTITTPEFKQSFEEFKKQYLMGGNKDVDESTLLEEFKRVVITEQAMVSGNCDLIPNEIDRAYCKDANKK